MADTGTRLRSEIVRVLEEHPEGLSIQEISSRLNVHRHTASKHVSYLDGAGEIFVRRVGATSLIYKRGKMVPAAGKGSAGLAFLVLISISFAVTVSAIAAYSVLTQADEGQQYTGFALLQTAEASHNPNHPAGGQQGGQGGQPEEPPGGPPVTPPGQEDKDKDKEKKGKPVTEQTTGQVPSGFGIQEFIVPQGFEDADQEFALAQVDNRGVRETVRTLLKRELPEGIASKFSIYQPMVWYKFRYDGEDRFLDPLFVTKKREPSVLENFLESVGLYKPREKALIEKLPKKVEEKKEKTRKNEEKIAQIKREKEEKPKEEVQKEKKSKLVSVSSFIIDVAYAQAVLPEEASERAVEVSERQEVEIVPQNKKEVKPKRDPDKVREDFEKKIGSLTNILSPEAQFEVINAIEDLTPVDVQDIETSYDNDEFEVRITVRDRIGTTLRIVDISNSLGVVDVYRYDGEKEFALFTTRSKAVDRIFVNAGDAIVLRGDVNFLPIEFFAQLGEEVLYFKSLPFAVVPPDAGAAVTDVLLTQRGTKFDIDFVYPVGSISILGSIVPPVLDLSGLSTEYKEEIILINGTEYRSVIIGLDSNVTQRLKFYDRIEVQRPVGGQLIVCHNYDFGRGICAGSWESVTSEENVGLSAFGMVTAHTQPSGETTSEDMDMELSPATIAPDKNFNNLLATKETAGLSAFAFIVPLEVNVTPSLRKLKDVFLISERPDFDYEFFAEEEIKKSGKQVVKSLKLPQKGRWATENETIDVEVTDPLGNVIIIPVEITELREGKFDLKLDSKRATKAGIYKIKVILSRGGKTFVSETEFGWGLVSMNTRKSIYRPGETAEMIFVVLDGQGRSVCDANINALVIDPLNQSTSLSTLSGTIIPNAECGLYDASYNVSIEGNHTVNITATTSEVVANFSTFFLVQQNFDYDIIRNTQSKIDPVNNPNSFGVAIDIESFAGPGPLTVREFVPNVFNLSTDGSVEELGDTKVITWQRSLDDAGKTNVSYSYSVPLVFPQLYALGRAEVNQGLAPTFAEARNWFVAVDPIEQQLGALACAIQNGTQNSSTSCGDLGAQDSVYFGVNAGAGSTSSAGATKFSFYNATNTTVIAGTSLNRVNITNNPIPQNSYPPAWGETWTGSNGTQAQYDNTETANNAYYTVTSTTAGREPYAHFDAVIEESVADIQWIQISAEYKGDAVDAGEFCGFFTANYSASTWNKIGETLTTEVSQNYNISGSLIADAIGTDSRLSMVVAGTAIDNGEGCSVDLFNAKVAWSSPTITNTYNASVNLSTNAITNNTADVNNFTVTTVFRFNITDATKNWYTDILNQNSGAWEQFSSGTLTTSVTTKSVTKTSPGDTVSNYVNSTGKNVKLRIRTDTGVSSPFRIEVDFLNLTLNYTCKVAIEGTSACYTRVQDAINAASASQTVVIVDSEEYNEAVEINVTGLTLTTNATPIPTIFTTSTTTAPINITANAVTVKGLNILYNGTGSINAVDARSRTGINITNNTINNTGSGSGHGIFFTSTSSSKISNNTIVTSGGSTNVGIYIQTVSNSNNITQNIISTGGTGSNRGMNILSSDLNNVSQNTISTSGTGTSNYGIYLQSGSDSNNVTHNTINTKGTGSDYGIRIDTAVSNNVTQNTINTSGTGPNNYGFLLSTSASFNTLAYNNVSTGGSGGLHYGIYIFSTSDSNNITNNNITTNGTTDNYGIFLQTTSDSNKVVSNKIDARGNGINNIGIYLQSSSNNNVSLNNVTTNGTQFNVGFYISTNANNNTFFSNNVTTNGTADGNFGFQLDVSSYNNSISSNWVLTGGTADNHGFLFTDANLNNISSNTITTSASATDYGVMLESTSNNNTFKDNIITATLAPDIRDQVEIAGNRNYFINNTFTRTDISFSTLSRGKIFVQWRVDVKVVDGSDSPISDATVVGNDTDAGAGSNNIDNPTSNFTGTTNSTGFITQQELTEFLANLTYNESTAGTGYLYFTNYTINASKTGFVTNSTALNLTSSKSTLVTMTLSPFVDAVFPNFTFNFTSVESGTQYTSGRNYGFQANWSDNTAVDKVLFEADLNETLRNYTVSLQAGSATNGRYVINFTDIGAGTYQYRWIANDTSDNVNSTAVVTYTIAQAATNMSLFLNGSEGNRSYSLNDLANFTAKINVSSAVPAPTITLQSNFTGFTPQTGSGIVYNTTSLGVDGRFFNLTANFSGNQNYTGSVRTTFFNVSAAPQYESNFTSVASGAQYAPGRNYGYQINWTDAGGVEQVLFEANLNDSLTNYTVPLQAGSANDGRYVINFTDIGAGTYQYRWVASDASNNVNSTPVVTYSITQNATNFVRLTINNNTAFDDQNVTITYNTSVTITGTSLFVNAPSATVYRNTSATALQQSSNPETVVLGAGSHNITVNVTSNVNYTANATGATFFVFVNKGSTNGSVFIDDLPVNKTITYTTSVTIKGNSTISQSGLTFNLFRNTTANGYIQVTNPESIVLGAGSYNLVFNTSGNANWTSTSNNSLFLFVNKGTPTLNLFLNNATNNLVATYPDSTVEARGNLTSLSGSGDLTFALYRNTSTTSAQLATGNPAASNLQLGNDTYFFTYNTTGGANWTSGFSATRKLVVQKGNLTSFTDVLINGAKSDATITYPSNATVAGTFNSSGAVEITFKLFRDNTDVTAQNDTAHDLGAGTYVFRYGTNQASLTNWTLSNSTTKTLTVNTGAPELRTFIDNLPTNKTVTYPTSATLKANTTSGGVLPTLEFYRNNTLIGSGNNAEQTITLGAGSHQLIYNNTANANWSSTQNSSLLVFVNRGEPKAILEVNGTQGNRDYNLTETINLTATTTNTAAIDKLQVTVYANFTGAFANITPTATEPQTNISAPNAGRYVAIANVTSNANWTSNATGVNYSINVVDRRLLVTLNNPDPATFTESNPKQNNQNTTFGVNATVTCSVNVAGYTCGTVNATVRRNSTTTLPTDTISTTVGATPFYVVEGSQPQTLSLGAGESAQFNWTINATGTVQTTWTIDVVFNSTHPSVSQNDTANAFVNISQVAADVVAPQFNTNATSQASGQQYSPARNYGFQANWTDNVEVSTVRFETNLNSSLTNYTVNRESGTATNGRYVINFTEIGAGTYYYRWIGTDSNSNVNSTANVTFTVLQNTTNLVTLTINNDGTPVDNQNETSAYPTSTTVTASNNFASSGTSLLFRNGTSISNPQGPITLGVGSYEYKVNTSGNANYTGNDTGATFYLFINKGTPTLNLFLNNATNNLVVTYPDSTVEARGNLTSPQGSDDLTFNLYRNTSTTSTSVGSGNPAASSVRLGNNTYAFEYNTTGGANWTSARISRILIVQKGIAAMTISTSPSQTVTYPTATTVTGSQSSTGDDDVTYRLSRDDLLVTSGVNSDQVDGPRTLGAGSYTYKLNSTSGENYTVNDTGVTVVVTVNQGAPDVKLFIDNLPTNKTITYPATATVKGNTSSTEVLPTFSLYRNNTLLGSGSSVEDSTQVGVGSYQLTFNTSGNANWTSTSNSSLFVFVNKGDPSSNLNLFLNNASSDLVVTYPDSTREARGNFTTLAGSSDLTFALYRNTSTTSTQLATGNPAASNLQLGNDTYFFTYNTTGGANWTSGFSATRKLIVQRGALLLSIQASPSATVTYPTTTTVSGNQSSTGDGDVTYRLYRFDNLTSSGTNANQSETKELAAGIHSYKFNATSGANYSVNDTGVSLTLTVSRGTITLNTFINNGTSNLVVTYPSSTVEARGNVTVPQGAGDVTFALYRNTSTTSTSVGSGNPAASNIQLGNDTYTFVYNSTLGQNYSVSSSTKQLIVQKGNLTSFTDVTIDGNKADKTITYPTSATAAGTFNSTGDGDLTLKLFRGELDVTSSENNTARTLGVGTHQYRYGVTAAGANWTAANSTVRTLTVNQGTANLSVFVDNLPTNKTVTYPASATLKANTTSGGVLPTLEFYRNNTLIGSGSSVSETISLGAGSHRLFYNTSGNANWTSSENNTIFVFVNKGAPSLNLFLDNATSNLVVTYPDSTREARGNISLPQGADDLTFTLYRETSTTSTQLATGNPAVSSVQLGNNTYTLIYNTTGGSNWTSAAATNRQLIVLKGALLLSVAASPSDTVTYPTTTTVTGTQSSTGDGDVTYRLLRDNTLVDSDTNANVAETKLLGAASYAYKFNATSGDNYTVNDTGVSLTLTINQNASTKDFINLTVGTGVTGSEADFTATYPTTTNATARFLSSVFGDQTITLTLYRNATTVGTTNPISNVAQLGAGTYNYSYNTSGNANYSSGQKSFLLTINKGSPKAVLQLDGSESGRDYNLTENVNSTASTQNTATVDKLQVTIYANFTGAFANITPTATEPQTNLSVPNAGRYTVIANVTSNANWTSNATGVNYSINVVDRKLLVTLDEPNPSIFTESSPKQIQQNATFVVNATVTCSSNPGVFGCGTVSATIRRNSSGPTPDVLISSALGATPLHLTEGAQPQTFSLAAGESKQVNWTVNASGALGVISTIDVNFTSTNGAISTNDTGNPFLNITAVVDTLAPQLYNNVTSVASGGTYFSSKKYGFQVNFSDNIGMSTVRFETDLNSSITNYTIPLFSGTSTNGTYVINFTEIGAGSYQYRWIGLDQVGNATASAAISYSVAQNTTNFMRLTINNGTDFNDRNVTTTYNTSTTATGANLFGAQSGTATLFRNGTSVSNPDTTLFGAGSYQFKTNTSGNANHSSNATGATFFLFVNRGTSQVKVFIDNLATNKTVTYPTSVTLKANTTTSGFDAPTFNFYRNNTLIGSGFAPETTIELTAGSYKLFYNTSGNANWTSAENNTIFLFVNRGSLSNFVDVLLNGVKSGTTITYPSTATVAGTFNASGATDVTFKLYRSGLDVTSQNNTAPDLGAGTYNYIYGTSQASAANYTVGNSTTKTLTVNTGSVDLKVFVDDLPVSKTVTYSTSVTLKANTTSGGVLPTLNFYRNNTLIGSGSSVSQSAALGVGTHILSYNTSGNANWTSGNNNSIIVTVNRGDPSSNLNLFLNNATSNLVVTYPSSTVEARGNVTSLSGSGDLTFALYRNTATTSTQITTGNPAASNLQLGNDTYTFVYNTTGGSNWTTGAATNRQVIVQKGALVLSISASPSDTVTYPTTTTVTGTQSSTGDGDVTYKLFRDGTLANSSTNANQIEARELAAASYSYKFNATSGANYSVNDTGVSLTLTVNRGTITLNTFLDNATSNLVKTYPDSTVEARGNVTVPSGGADVTFTLYRNTSSSSVSLGSGSNVASNLQLGNDTYIFVYNSTLGQNYSVSSSTKQLIVQKGNLTSFTDVTIDGVKSDATVTYPSTATVAGTFNSTGANDLTLKLFRGNSDVTSENNTAQIIGVGANQYRYGVTAAGANWTAANSTVKTLTVNTGTPELRTFIDDLPVNKTLTYPASATLKANTTSGGVLPTLEFYRNNTLIGSGSSVSQSAALGAGSYRLIYNSTANANWSSAQNNSLFVFVNSGATSVSLFFNGSNTDRSYNAGDTANITVATNVSGTQVTLYTNFSDGTYKLWDGPGSSPLTNFTRLDTTGTFNFTGNFSGDANLSAAFQSFVLKVDQVGLSITPTADSIVMFPGSSINKSFNVTANGTAAATNVAFSNNASNLNFTLNYTPTSISSLAAGATQNVSEYTVVMSGTDSNFTDAVFLVRTTITAGNFTGTAVHDLYINVTKNHTVTEPVDVPADTIVNISKEANVNLSLQVFVNQSLGTIQFNLTRTLLKPVANGVEVEDLTAGKYINITKGSALNDTVIKWIVVNITYSQEEVDAAGIDESTLAMWRYSDSGASWTKMTTAAAPSIVYSSSVDTTNNYAWANVSTLSLFSLAGLKKLGESCTSGAQCQTGICSAGVCSLTEETPPAPAPSVGGGGGGGGAAVPTLPTGTGLTRIVKTPVLVGAPLGGEAIAEVEVRNAHAESTASVKLGIEGVPGEWATIAPFEHEIPAGETKKFLVILNVPKGAEIRDYQVFITAASQTGSDRSSFFLRPSKFSEATGKPLFTRTVGVDVESGTTEVTINVANQDRSFAQVQLFETIDKSLAQSAGEIIFSIDNRPRVVRDDPQLLYTFQNVGPGETRSVSYTLRSIVADISKLVYWPFDQIMLIGERFPSGFRASEIAEATFLQGYDSRFTIAVQNQDGERHRLVTSLELPEGWTAEPASVTEEFGPFEQKSVGFNVKVPSDAAIGKYIVTVNYDWDGTLVSKEVVVNVETVLGVATIMTVVVVVIAAAAGIILWLRRRGGRRGALSPYRKIRELRETLSER